MKKLICLLLFSLSLAVFDPSIRIRPSYTVGKMTNGNFYSEIMPLRISWNPLEEWYFGIGYSLGFESPRGSNSIASKIMGNHRGWATRVSAQYKPLKFLQIFFPDTTMTDFYIKYEKQISGYYDGSTLAIGRLDYNPWEEISIGFDILL